MALTVEDILRETNSWPVEKVDELVNELTFRSHPAEIEHEEAWRTEIRRRVQEIENGTAMLIEGQTVSEEVRRIVQR